MPDSSNFDTMDKPQNDSKPPAGGGIGALLGFGKSGSDDPSRDIRFGMAVVFIFFVVLMGWATFARVDAAVYATGQIAVVGNLQEVAHKEGGIIAALHVKEGEMVRKGQELITMSGDETEANANALMGQYIDLKTREARLLAEQGQRAGFSEPVEFADLPEAFRPLINDTMDIQRKTMASNRTFLASQMSVLQQRVKQSEQQIVGNQEQMTANQTRQALTKEELTGVEDLNARGYAPTTRVRALQESVAGMEGEYGALRAQVAGAQAQIGETQMQAVGIRKQYIDNVMTDLNDTQGRLKTMEPQLVAARAAYDRLHVRATASGKVMGLSVSTVGGVIQPGQKLLDIVPEATPLVIKAMVPARNGNDIHPGQIAQVRFISLHEHSAPILEGKVLDVSGDAFTDKESGNTFYTARVQISPETLATLSRMGTEQLKPGLPVEVVVPMRERTVLQYILEPLNQSLWKTFRES
ncbi:HlyD family type I secretion periplasmic adaptor subunit [Asticcacaulis sp. AC402]|uniref:HlyD family type I secretion periplasmic adaptor subunit n=1 Tax=Asticcacaulis sp. AC402 TaxID=1282361 RepID=UPI0003C3F74B|nr:HlyD family type I secretion periplasmic adaptor subunit [Asticcacaulis sp. AC402]ESQ76130.1 hypothetical protein ABAC402_06685 [Asticcacaulis sp. AC402]